MTGPTSSETIALRCMQIWGGNRPIREAISTPGIDATVRSETYKGGDSGGDVYYISTCAMGKIARFALADVSGHGEEAARVGESLRTMLRKNMNTLDQSELMTDLSREVLHGDTEGRFATAVLATYFAPTGHVILTNAGHPRPLLYRASAHCWTLVDHETIGAGDLGAAPADLPLGIVEEGGYHRFPLHLAAGDALLLYTDALVESADAEGAMLGEGGLLEVVAGLEPGDPGAMLDELEAHLADRRSGAPADDDATVIYLTRNGGAPPALTLADRARSLGAMLGLTRVDLHAGA